MRSVGAKTAVTLLSLFAAIPLSALPTNSLRPKIVMSGSVQSEKNEFLGSGKNYTLSSGSGIVYTGTEVNSDGQLTAITVGWGGNQVQNRSDAWSFTFRSPSGKPLTVGNYLNAVSYFAINVGDATFPGMEFIHNSSACDDDSGQFVISRLTYDCETVGSGSGKRVIPHILTLTLSFTHYCDTPQTPVFALRGNINLVDVAGTVCDAGGGGDGGGGTPTPTPTPQPSPTGPSVVLPDSVINTPIVMTNSSSSSVLFSTFVQGDATNDVSLSVATDAEDLLASVTPAVIKAPGSGDAIVKITTTPTTRAGDHVVTITATDGTVTSSASIFVTVLCDPPFILGIDQPKNSTVSSGRPAQLSVKAGGSGPFTYQWFTGASGLVNFPLAGGTSANFTTSALNDTTSYWVRVTNPCGSIDSQTATVNVSASAKPSGRR